MLRLLCQGNNDTSAVGAMFQRLTREELSSLFVRFGKAVQDKTLILTWVGHQLILHHLH